MSGLLLIKPVGLRKDNPCEYSNFDHLHIRSESSICVNVTQKPSRGPFPGNQMQIVFHLVALQRKHWMVKNKRRDLGRAGLLGNSPGYFSTAVIGVAVHRGKRTR